MVDNVVITPGTGATVAADDIGAGILAQRVKPVWGPDGTGNDTDVASGKAMPIQVRSATGLIPVGEPTDAKASQTDTTSVSIVSLLKQISFTLQSKLCGTGTFSTVASSATAVTLLASNASRLGATVYNESSQICYLGLSATAVSATAYTVQMAPNSYYEVPYGFTGAIQGIWVAANGNARLTEFSA